MSRPRQVLEEDALGKKISHIQFGTFASSEIERLAEFEVTSDRGYEQPNRTPVANGVLDRRLGISDKQSLCETCGQRMQDCPGHYGFIKLELPVYHIGYLKSTIAVLQCICKTCSRVLLKPEEQLKFRKTLNHPLTQQDNVRRTNCFKKIIDRCKKTHECGHCGSLNGLVKRVGCMHIVHEQHGKQTGQNAERVKKDFEATFEASCAGAKGAYENPQLSGADLRQLLPKAGDDINPLRARQLLSAIPDSELLLLEMAQEGRPENLLIDRLLVPPVALRPSVDAGPQGSNEDDLTVKLTEILAVNNIIRNAMDGGKATITNVMEDWEFLQLQCALYLNGGSVPGVRAEFEAAKKPIRAFAQRLKGKQGRFRGNLCGKRVDFSGRTVISPDPNLEIDEVGVPEHVARVLTYPERVFAHNLSQMRQLVLNGPEVWPGANYVESEGSKRALKFGDRRRTASELKVGDIVERHMSNGDAVLFNRQPSLHRLSIMSHRARVLQWRTFRFNECVCAPYNADFDGDEMNLHLPQTEEARTEARLLLGVHHNLITPRNGEVVIAATQDFITASYLVTRKNLFLTRSEFARLCAYLGDAAEPIELPPPAILKPVELWTGKQVFSVLLRPNSIAPISINGEGRNKRYNVHKAQPEPLHMCEDDGYVCFQDSELLCGVLDKSWLGDGQKNGLFAILLRDVSRAVAARCMSRMAKLASRFLCDFGFSIGIGDVMPTANLTRLKAKLIRDGTASCREKIEEFERGTLEPSPGCTAELTLENIINGDLSKLRDQAGEVCKKELHFLNAPLTMAISGSKGSFINISQMVACVGQQSVSGKRMPDGFIHRALPHFPRHSRDPDAKGFVANSFYTGLTPPEFFFHTMGGREGLVDTAVKTAETGYMARRLMKALEDLTAQYDGSVRNSEGNIVQYTYGDDGLDPSMMEAKDGRPINFERTRCNEQRRVPEGGVGGETAGPLLSGAALRALLQKHLSSKEFAATVKRSLPGDQTKYEKELCAFVEKIAAGFDELDGVEAPPPTPTPAPGAPAPGRGKGKAKAGTGDGEEAGPTPRAGRQASKRGRARVVDSDSDDDDDDAVKPEADAPDAPDAPPAPADADATADAPPQPPLSEDSLQRRRARMSPAQAWAFLRVCLAKYRAARIEPGSAVGAVGAQSIGEPGTQMTLKTFHFAGVASMNITLGVPRIKEIINAAKTISTPIIKAQLEKPYDEESARVVKGYIERTRLGEVCTSICEVYDAHECYVSIQLDLARIRELHLTQVTARSVRAAILANPKLRIKETDVHVDDASSLKVHASRSSDRESTAVFELQRLQLALKDVVVAGITEISRAIISRKENDEKTDDDRDTGRECFQLLVEGIGLQAVMGVHGLIGEKTTTTHIMEVEKVLGIEAARKTTMDEIQYTMGQHGMDIDDRHVTLLADVMTFRGEVLGITRFGVPKMKQSVLMLASFEKTSDHLYDAAVHSRTDAIAGVSECIITGVPMPVGTGLFKLLQRVPRAAQLPTSRPLLVGRNERE